MRLWLLKPRKNLPRPNPWETEKAHWAEVIGKALKFVVRAETEEIARMLAQEGGGDETDIPISYDIKITEENVEVLQKAHDGVVPAWSDPQYSTCEELSDDGKPGIIAAEFGGE